MYKEHKFNYKPLRITPKGDATGVKDYRSFVETFAKEICLPGHLPGESELFFPSLKSSKYKIVVSDVSNNGNAILIIKKKGIFIDILPINR